MTAEGNSSNGPGAELPPPGQPMPGGFPVPVQPSDPGPVAPAPPQRRPGSIRVQNAESSQPRPPTAAEVRQREKVRKAREAAEELAAQQELARERRAARQRKVLMGSVAVVGVAGVIGLSYVMSDRSDREVSATCVKDGTDEVVPEEYCSSGRSGVGGIFIFAGSPYRYYYGGTNGGPGTIARGGTLELPKNTAGRTASGSTITRAGKGSGVSITRGGFGSGSHGGSGGG